MVHIDSAQYLGDYKIRLSFNTGEQGDVDLDALLHRYPIAGQLKDKLLFAQFYLDEWPTLAWPCGFDVSPETLYEMATGKTVSWLKQA
nr:DUF2442 domain-containing protein [uncultured Deefgea sp.]